MGSRMALRARPGMARVKFLLISKRIELAQNVFRRLVGILAWMVCRWWCYAEDGRFRSTSWIILGLWLIVYPWIRSERRWGKNWRFGGHWERVIVYDKVFEGRIQLVNMLVARTLHNRRCVGEDFIEMRNGTFRIVFSVPPALYQRPQRYSSKMTELE